MINNYPSSIEYWIVLLPIINPHTLHVLIQFYLLFLFYIWKLEYERGPVLVNYKYYKIKIKH